MFFNKKEIEKKEGLQVKCEECKHYIDIGDAQKVIQMYAYTFIPTENIYYCPLHKKRYYKKLFLDFKTKYFGEMEMNNEGEPIGYKKHERTNPKPNTR